MTPFCPAVPQSFDALKASPPPGLEALSVVHYGKRLWIAVVGRPQTALAVQPMAGPGLELIRYHDDEPNAVLQALADYWHCPIVSRYDERERFDPRV